jgi:hypothetical protein
MDRSPRREDEAESIENAVHIFDKAIHEFEKITRNGI